MADSCTFGLSNPENKRLNRSPCTRHCFYLTLTLHRSQHEATCHASAGEATLGLVFVRSIEAELCLVWSPHGHGLSMASVVCGHSWSFPSLSRPVVILVSIAVLHPLANLEGVITKSTKCENDDQGCCPSTSARLNQNAMTRLTHTDRNTDQFAGSFVTPDSRKTGRVNRSHLLQAAQQFRQVLNDSWILFPSSPLKILITRVSTGG